jgi:hypothetical protein
MWYVRPATAASGVVGAGHALPVPQPDQVTATPMTSAQLSSVAPVGVKRGLSLGKLKSKERVSKPWRLNLVGVQMAQLLEASL